MNKIVYLKNRLIVIVIFLSLSILSYSQDLERITEIDKNYQRLLNDNFSNVSTEDLIFYFSVVSEDVDNYQFYLKYFNSLIEKIDEKMIDTSFTKKEVAEKLLMLMHELVTKKYQDNATTISELSKGYYNCVTSVIFYGILLKRYEFDFYGVYTTDHTFIVVTIDGKNIDVETTNMYGFDPGNKKAILDEIGKITKYSYVPAKNYMRKNIIYKDQFFLITNNLISIFSGKKEFLKAMKLSFILLKNGNKIIYTDELIITINNYTNDLINNKKYEEAIKIFNWYLSNIGIDKNILDMKAIAIKNYAIDWKDYNDLNILKNFLDRELNIYPIDNTKKSDIYKYCYSRAVMLYNNENRYEKSFQAIYDFTKIDSSKNLNDSKEIFDVTINNFAIFSSKNDITFNNSTENIFDNLFTAFPQWSKKIDEYKKNYYLLITQRLVKDKKYSEAFDRIERLEKIYTVNDSKIKELKIELYTSYTIYLYENGDYKNTILYCDKALKEFPNNATIKNNYKVFLNNFIINFYNNKNYPVVKYVLNRALEEFPNEKNFIIYRNDLKLE